MGLLNFDASKFVKQAEQSVTAKLSRVVESKILNLESKSGTVGVLTKIAGEVGLTDEIFQQITNTKSMADDFASGQFNKVFSAVKNRGKQPKTTATTKIDQPTGTPPLKYPLNIGTFCTTLQFMNYHRPVPLQSPVITPSQVIVLPLPKQMQDAHGVDYSQNELGFIGSIADTLDTSSGQDGQAQSTGAQAGLAVGRAVVGKMGGLAGQAGLAKLGGMVAAASLSDEVAAATSQYVGASLNPNLSVTFKSPQLRKFSMSWSFAPHNAKESAAIKKIIGEIKKRMLPSMTYADGTSILSYPEMVVLSLEPNVNVDGQPMFKKAMIESINVNYADNGAPTFFEGTKDPVFIGLDIGFCEIEYFLSEDFGGEGGKGLNKDFLDTLKKASTSVTTLLPKPEDVISTLTSKLNPQGG